MTSELRPAVAVWIDAKEAYARSHKPDPQDCRITLADPFAPAAVIEADREAVRAEQAAELAKFKALAETLAGALDEWVFRYYWRHEGMNTEQARIYAKAQTEMMLRQYKEARDDMA